MVSRVNRSPSPVVSSVHGSVSLASLLWPSRLLSEELVHSSGVPWLWVSYSEGRINIKELMGTATVCTLGPLAHTPDGSSPAVQLGQICPSCAGASFFL